MSNGNTACPWPMPDPTVPLHLYLDGFQSFLYFLLINVFSSWTFSKCGFSLKILCILLYLLLDMMFVNFFFHYLNLISDEQCLIRTITAHFNFSYQNPLFFYRYLQNHLNNLFAGAFEDRDMSPLEVRIPQPTANQGQSFNFLLFSFSYNLIALSFY